MASTRDRERGTLQQISRRVGHDLGEFEGIATQRDAASIGPGQLQDCYNIRRRGGRFLARGGQSKVATDQLTGCVIGILPTDGGEVGIGGELLYVLVGEDGAGDTDESRFGTIGIYHPAVASELSKTYDPGLQSIPVALGVHEEFPSVDTDEDADETVEPRAYSYLVGLGSETPASSGSGGSASHGMLRILERSSIARGETANNRAKKTTALLARPRPAQDSDDVSTTPDANGMAYGFCRCQGKTFIGWGSFRSDAENGKPTEVYYLDNRTLVLDEQFTMTAPLGLAESGELYGGLPLMEEYNDTIVMSQILYRQVQHAIYSRSISGTWSSLSMPGSLTAFQAHCMRKFEGDLYIAGSDTTTFSANPGTHVANAVILKWDGTSLTVVRTITPANQQVAVRGMEVKDGLLYYIWGRDPFFAFGGGGEEPAILGTFDGTTWTDTVHTVSAEAVYTFGANVYIRGMTLYQDGLAVILSSDGEAIGEGQLLISQADVTAAWTYGGEVGHHGEWNSFSAGDWTGTPGDSSGHPLRMTQWPMRQL